MRLNAGQHVRAGTISGSSAGLARGLLHDEADLKQYAKPKRRKAVKQGVHVNQADLVGHLHRPVKEPVGAEYPTPKPQRRVGRKIMTVSKKVWSNQ